ncbi:hypothetical protein F441_05060 [Phytophthora nicotianae CJ01A1]|uniref:DNA/RNA-binding protein Alba-like domain-containing protein n=5 Tax=Phytophthora nicotianae TaxID=4792 RepID=W2QHU1_PHYN3|nr:hypothetical protein PPTG_09270 [Phytophthora nicotianae INRA-310]ETI51707.1 hypothetical protein F443_05054 [Phytophthora nicotianae P1569]ETL44943.1 hypothetical protein L916_04872 [Phytophthora nicotianae]ETO80459.1 hypothetical protein F444_05103 [Phytophthora nicotianae P1976]ETP21491.1 hypothetical protein F441_05060 [Phytophthora nicotianae CJ01A1]KUF96813.1 hypothetical protein AM588_10007956 [Phytophthora nicotianae]
MSHYGRAGGERVTLAVDLDHTLTKLLECAAAWHEAEHGAKIDAENVASASWATVWGGGDAESKTHQFFESKKFETELAAVAGANEVLKPLRKYFSLLAITDRPRFVEKQTREWLDHHLSGVFDKLVFVDEDSPEHLVARKKELYDDLKVKVAVGSDAAMLTEAAEHVGHVVIVGSVPWTKPVEKSRSGVTQVTEWSEAKETFDQLIKDLELQPLDKIFAGPRLARYTDDLVTVSTRKPAVFYANIINSKFMVQKQETVRLQASEAAITTAVQAAEILRIQNNAITTKISTRYALNRPKDRGGYRVPKLELVLQRVAPKA